MGEFDEHNPRLRLLVGIATVLIVVGGLWVVAGLIWPEDNGQIAILKADNAPYKVKPDQPGGLQVPDKDKLIFNTVSSEGKTVTVERILPGPEQPLNVENKNVENNAGTATPVAPPSVPPVEMPPVQAALPQASVVPPPVPVAPAPVAPAMGRVLDAPTATPVAPPPVQPVKPAVAFDISKGEVMPFALKPPEPVKEVVKETPVKEAVKETPKEPEEEVDNTPPKTKVRSVDTKKEAVDDNQDDAEPVKGKTHFQVASFFDKPSADKGLAQFKSKYTDALRGASLGIVTATINGNKQVWRLQGSAANANDVCSDIKAKGGSCVIIRP
ncbi:MAG: SPOR domain-containing protein [Alphaproteobacteria bacterium]|nr:SPOR domain-containing protein [Alphaproteobacteria bacterium]